MKSAYKTYELQIDQWVEIKPQSRPRSLLDRLAVLLVTASAVAVILAVGIVVAALALILLPVASLIALRRPR
jgi:hypothetical protein